MRDFTKLSRIRGSLGTLVIALALVTTGCGGQRTETVIERKDETHVEYLNEEKSRIVPAVRHVLDRSTGDLSLTFYRKIKGPIYRAEKFLEVTKEVKKTRPNLPVVLFANTILLGSPLLATAWDPKLRKDHFGSSEELSKEERVVIDKTTAEDTGRTGKKILPYVKAPFLLRLGEAQIKGHADAVGEATVNLFEIIAGNIYPERIADEELVIETAIGNATENLPILLNGAGRSVLTQFAHNESERRARLEKLGTFTWGGDKNRLHYLAAAGSSGYQYILNEHKFYTSLPPPA